MFYLCHPGYKVQGSIFSVRKVRKALSLQKFIMKFVLFLDSQMTNFLQSQFHDLIHMLITESQVL